MFVEDQIIKNLLSHSYPDNGAQDEYKDSFGICFSLTRLDSLEVFDGVNDLIDRTFKSSFDHLKNLSEDDLRPQFILDHKRGEFLLEYQFYRIDTSLDERFSLIVRLSSDKVKILLSHLIKLGISITDVLLREVY